MALSAMMGLWDDAGAAVMRMLGKGSAAESDMIPYENPEQLVAALRNPATEAKAVARMRKMHYGEFYGKNSRGMFSGMAESELLNKGTGFSGAVFGRPVKGLGIGITHFKAATAFAGLQGLVGGAFAERGHKFSGAAGGLIRGIAYGVGDLIGTTLAGPVGGIALGMAFDAATAPVTDVIQSFVDFNKHVRHVNMGGNYEDTRTAYTMRQRAAQEMGSSVMNARAWLGKEAALLHQ